jgi:TM2 domain-containing membrane protein YozV
MVINHFRSIQITWIIVFLSIQTSTFSQRNPDCDLKFITHLVNTGCFEEALYLLDSSDCSSILMNDSINYLRGWSLYSLNQPVSSSENLLKITPASSLYLKSHFYAAYNYSQTGNFDKATEALDKIELKTDSLNSLKNYQIAGIKLLQGDLPSFEEWFNKVNRGHSGITDSYDRLLSVSVDMKNHRSKSPLIAGLMSGIIPGSGKLYAGKTGEAISAFLSTAGLGLVTLENYRKSGLNSFKTIAFGSVLAVTYIANIYGSAFTVRILETEYKENVKSTILFDLHISLRSTFNK